MGLIPDWGTKTLHAVEWNKKNKTHHYHHQQKSIKYSSLQHLRARVEWWTQKFGISYLDLWACLLKSLCHIRLYYPMDLNLPGSSVYGILQARILEWLPCLHLGNLPSPGIKPMYLKSPALSGGFFTTRAIWEALFGFQFSPVQFSRSVMSDSLQPHESQHARLPVHHQLPEFTQTHVHWVGDAIQPSHPLTFPSPPASNPSQHHSLFQWVNSSHEVAKVLEFQLEHHSL